MEIITIVYLTLMFIALYMFSFFVIITLRNKERLFEFPHPKKIYSLSIVVPCYNEEGSIEKNIKSLLNSDYPGLEKIIVVDDCSKDNSFEIIKKLAQKYPKVMAVRTPKNTGNAAGSKNYGTKFVETELIGFSDADTHSNKDAISKMVGFFNDPKMSAVTSFVRVRNRDQNFFTKVQSLEYMIMGWSRKLLDFVDSVYVTNGPLSIYLTKYFREVGGFDETSITEDIEITWNMLNHGYKTAMSLDARVSTITPHKRGEWFRQRTRWGLGGLQAISKYRKMFFKKGMFGGFILPFVSLSIIVSLITFSFSSYLIIRSLLVRGLTATSSLASNISIFHFQKINLYPSVIIFYLIVLASFSLVYYNYVLYKTKYEEKLTIKRFFNLLFYMMVYSAMYPTVWFASIYRFIKKDHKW
ncbi:glycosyltransferase family 2 protein [Candidatus Pacearchaeota archaeon]|nr:glycosyltransferase family 2 protein [Candidatus Pacearchaeota archaeon]